MKRIASYLPIFAVTFVALLLVGWFYGDALLHPNKYLFGKAGDGIKNYYNPCYYMKHDTGVRTTAFTYPYGEVALFTDSHFSMVYLLNLIDDHVAEINQYTVGFINLAMMLSSVLCALFLFLIFRFFKLPDWYALIFALIIAFLSPQLERLTAHFSLAWSFFIPMIWYFLLRLQEWKRPLLWWLMLVFSVLFFGFLHPYYLPAGMFFMLAFAGVYFLQEILSLNQHYKQIISVLTAAILPFIVFSIFIAINDPVTDRHEAPYGMFAYNTKFEGAFMPNGGPLFNFLNRIFVITPTKDFEGHAYIGIIGILALIFTALRLIWNLIKKRWSFKRLFVNQTLGISVIASGLLFYLATGSLFRHFEFLLELIPRLRQFRSLGRFAWVLYYCFGVYAAYLLYLCYRSLSIRGWRPVGLVLLLGLGGGWALESFLHANYFIGQATKNQYTNDVFFKDQNFFTKALATTNYKPEDFQALIGFPYINNGTEKLYIYRHGNAPLDMMKCAYETGIPLATFHSPRTSIKQGTQLAQLVSSPFIKKEILSDFNDKPLLLIESSGDIWHDGRRLLDKAEKIYDIEGIKLYKADLSIFQTNHQQVTEQFNKTKHSFIKHKNFWTSKPTNAVTLIRYPVSDSTINFRSKGIYQSGESQEQVVFENQIDFDGMAEFIEISAWLYMDKQQSSLPVLQYEEFDNDGNVVQFQAYSSKQNTEVMTNFARATLYLKPKNASNRVRITIKTENNSTKNIGFADVLIRPSNLDVFFDIKADSTFVFNNYNIYQED